MRNEVKRAVSAIICTVLLLIPVLKASAQETLITDYNTLMSAVNEAKDGDTLLVGDIDFSPTSPTVPNSYMCITVNKSLTIKSGKDEAALFTNGGFILGGSKVSTEKITVKFENIVFDGKVDSQGITEKDFEYPKNEAGEATAHAPLKAQQALSFKGNVDASFEGCSFKNYMHENGPVIDIRYGDYTDNSYLLDIFGDHSGCALNLNFAECSFENNTALYDGGAIYIDSNKNVVFNATNCVFSGNRSTVGEFSRGGGAIYANGATLNFSECTMEKNIGNNIFVDSKLPDYDTHRGGAIMLEGGELTLVNSVIKENRCSLGGGISMTNSKADIDCCRFTVNRAQGFGKNNSMIGPWSNMGQGGAVYVEGMNGETVSLVNCEIRDNVASTAYGGLYAYYTPNVDPSLGTYFVKMSLCTYEGNKSETKYNYADAQIYPWASHPGDMFVNPHLTLFGSYIVDEAFGVDFPRNETPTAENGYNFLSAVDNGEMRAFEIPLEAAVSVIGERYEGKLKEVHIGSNYSESLFKEEEPPADTEPAITEETEMPETTAEEKEEKKQKPKSINVWVIIIISASALAVCAAVVLVLKKKTAHNKTIAVNTAEEKKQIIKTHYTDEEIEYFVSNVPEVNLLTGRETEVLCEILKGRKQSEVAYYLGIEVTTVKDFYKKIYVKFNVHNKDELLTIAAEALKNK